MKFKLGDKVKILTGTHRGKVGIIVAPGVLPTPYLFVTLTLASNIVTVRFPNRSEANFSTNQLGKVR